MTADLQSKLWYTEIWQHAEKQMLHGLFMTPQYDLPSSTMIVNYYSFKNQYDEHWFILHFLLSLHLWLSDTVGPTLKKLERYHLVRDIALIFPAGVFLPGTVSASFSLWLSSLMGQSHATWAPGCSQHKPEKKSVFSPRMSTGTSSKFFFFFIFVFTDTNIDIWHDQQITL